MSDKAQQEFVNIRLDKLEKFQKDLTEKVETLQTNLAQTNQGVSSDIRKLSDSVTQYGSAVDAVSSSLKKLQLDIPEQLNLATEKIIEASGKYIDQKLSGVPTTQITTTTTDQKPKGALEGVFDRLSGPGGPIERVVNGVADRLSNANLPLLGSPAGQAPAGATPVQSEIVDLDRQLKNAASVLYRNSLKDALSSVNRKLAQAGLPTGDVPRLTHTP